MLRFRALTVLLILLIIPALAFAQEAQQPQEPPAEQPAEPAPPDGTMQPPPAEQPQAGEQPQAAQQPQAAPQVPLDPPYYSMASLANQPVMDPQGNQVGTVKDGFISSSGLLTHWIVTAQNVPNVPAGDYLVPVYAIQVGLNGIVLNLPDPSQAQQAIVPSAGAKTAGVVATDAIRATELITYDLVDDQGQNIGTIEDIVINLETHEVAYAAIDFGGFLGAGQKMFAVPFSDIWYNLDQDTVTIFNLNTQALQQNPGFSPEDWPEEANPNWNRTAQ